MKFMLMLTTALLVSTSVLYGNKLPASLQVQALDEQGTAISGEEVEISFTTYSPLKQKNQAIDIKGNTDTEGKFGANSIVDWDIASVSVGEAKNYYRSQCIVTFLENHEKKRWEPWNPVIKLPVRKKLNPVPMFVKKVDLVNYNEKTPDSKLPNRIAFDVLKGDFCPPLGTGNVEDFIFNCQKNDDKSISVDMKFFNEEDGIILLNPEDPKNCLPLNKRLFDYNFTFKGPRFAPINGYGNFKWSNLFTTEKGTFYTKYEEEKKSFYIFRVRSKKNENSESINGIYGKIRDGIKFSVNNNGFIYIEFTYYCNPDGTRNLEFDPKQNLNKDPETSRGLNEP